MAEVINDIDLESNVTKYYSTFGDMNLHEPIVRACYNFGYREPSKIQQLGIVPIINGRDTVAQAQSGTGKTATFVLGILQRLYNFRTEKKIDRAATFALVLSPTRELAVQSYTVFKALSNSVDINCHVAVGGSPVREDMKAIDNGDAEIIIATPGRARHLIEAKSKIRESIRIICLDEADQLLDGNFTELCGEIISMLGAEIQIVLVSATMPPEIYNMVKDLMREPARIMVKADELTLEGIRQFFIDCDDENHKYTMIQQIYKVLSIQSCITFVNTRANAIRLHDDLVSDGHAVAMIHGEMEDEERRKVFRTFSQGACRILVTTDLMARGIDVQTVGLVINYDLPYNKETYLHRIGRSGRYGRKGTAVNLITSRDYDNMEEIATHYDTEISPFPDDASDLI